MDSYCFHNWTKPCAAGVLTSEQKTNLAKKITDLVVQETKQPKDYTWVVIHEEPMENWLVGGLTVAEIKAKLAQEKSKIPPIFFTKGLSLKTFKYLS